MPGDHQDGPADGDDVAFGAAAACDPPVPFAEEGVGLGRSGGGVAQDGPLGGLILAQVEEYGVTRLLDELAAELQEGRHRLLPARRVYPEAGRARG